MTDVFAKDDQLAPQVEVMDVAAVILGVDDRDRRAGEPGEILRAANFGKRTVLIEQVLQGDGVGDLPPLDQFADRRINPGVDGVPKMLGQQEFRNPRIRCVADQQRAQQGLFGVVVEGRDADQFGIGRT